MEEQLEELIIENNELQGQLGMWWPLDSIKEMMTGQLTMAKWDTFNDMLKEYYLEEYSTMIYLKRKYEDAVKLMKQIILETAQEWRISRPYQGKEIMSRVIEVITNENMEVQVKELTSKKNEHKEPSIILHDLDPTHRHQRQ